MHVFVFVYACVCVYVSVRLFKMLLQLRADEFDMIVCGSVACSRKPSELDDYMS